MQDFLEKSAALEESAKKSVLNKKENR